MEFIETKLVPQKIVYTNNDFRIYACRCDDPMVEKNSYDNVTIKGVMPRLDLGMEYLAQIELDEVNTRYGASYNCISIYQDVPEGENDQKEFFRYLLTENQVNEIYKVYEGQDIIELITTDQFDYEKVKGLGSYTYEYVKKKVLDNVKNKELIMKLGKYGITYGMVMKLSEKYNNPEIAIQHIEDNPYILTELSGVGFKKADVIAQRMGFKYNHPFRIQAGIVYTIEQNELEGNTFMFKKELIKSGVEILQVEEKMIEKEIVNTEGIICLPEDKIANLKTYYCEKKIAEKIFEIQCKSTPLLFEPEEFISRMEAKYIDKMPNGLSEQQKSFFYNIQRSSVNLLVGYAGTGKTAMQNLLVELLEELHMSYALLSPTGKAAKVLSGYTGKEAATIHRTIGYGQDKEEIHLYELYYDFIVVDEMSMTDVRIMSMLLSKIKNPNCRLLFCGDPFQLQSVAAGCVLHDMIESGHITTTKLDIVFRQSEGGILDIATKVRKKEKFIDDDFKGIKKFGKNLILHCVSQADVEDGYKHYYKKYLKMFDAKDILVLSPTKKGNLGTVEINNYIQTIVNPETEGKPQHSYGERVFRIDDYVMNIKNTYNIRNTEMEQLTIVNGDSGEVVNIISEGEKEIRTRMLPDGEQETFEFDPKGVYIQFDDDVVKFSFSELIQLIHSWAMTGHKSQGSSAKGVLIILDRAHKYQATANLLYTMITRAIDYCIILSQGDTINYAMRKVENLRRNTMLETLIRDTFTKTEEENDVKKVPV